MKERQKEIERSIITKFRKSIWRPFTKAVRDYELIQENDKIAVCISGGKDSVLLAKCLEEIKKHGKVNFDLVYIVMNPGYNDANLNEDISFTLTASECDEMKVMILKDDGSISPLCEAYIKN